jgi:Skp family chaperone for outer membrane proteins|tara:strand:+ start:17 stop:541 length:525 start_codon:yes stop_codon:yes gene_type:complete
MKYLVKFFVVTFFLLVSTYTFAEQKIVVLDMKVILNTSKAGKGAQDYLKKTFNENQKKYQKMEKDLKKEENDLLAKKNILSQEEYTKKTNELRKKVIDYQSERRSSLDKIATQRAVARENLLKEVNPIIDEYIKENNISLVMDKKNMIGGQTEFDITKEIIEKLNKKLPSLTIK